MSVTGIERAMKDGRPLVVDGYRRQRRFEQFQGPEQPLRLYRSFSRSFSDIAADFSA
ncbi:hypothetical protein ABZ926_04775 [Streptomyces litmocidini]|uniref:hypothetical protein n=1 Tax=Streptomyces litmocidini TaxID=67318 RepID=UPI0033DB45BA